MRKIIPPAPTMVKFGFGTMSETRSKRNIKLSLKLKI